MMEKWSLLDDQNLADLIWYIKGRIEAGEQDGPEFFSIDHIDSLRDARLQLRDKINQ